jgi:flagellar protein FlaG
MIASIISTAALRTAPQGTLPEGAAPSSSLSSAASARQTTALLPERLDPPSAIAADSGQQQDVNGQGQDQSRSTMDIRRAADRANAYFKNAKTHLEFSVGEETGQVVVKIIDSQTNQVVRMIPPEMMQRLADIATIMQGLLFDAKG